MCARKPPSTTLYRMSLSRRLLLRNTPVVAPPLPPACRSRIRFARNGILARAASPLFVARDDEPFATSQTTTEGQCAGEYRRYGRDRHRRLRDNRLLVRSGDHPVEHLLDGNSGPGATRWISARPDTIEQILVEFDRPQAISRLVYEVEEEERERTQEVRVEVSEDGGRTYRQILVQEYNFSPGGATYQREEQRLNLSQVSRLRLTIVPNKNGSGTATLTTFRLYA